MTARRGVAMARYDYTKPVSTTVETKLPGFSKKESSELPQFTKEVPLRTIMKRHGSNVILEYEWSVFGGEEIKISVLCSSGDEKLRSIHNIRIKDGEEVGFFRIADTVYIIRKTSESVAKELIKTSGKIKASVAEVVGYLKTMNGNFYSISKVQGDGMCADGRTGLRQFHPERLEKVERRKFTDSVVSELLSLCSQGYSLAGFNIKDVLVAKRSILLGNINSIAKAGPTKCVQSFLLNIRSMARSGLLDKGDVAYAIALSFAQMESQYSKWANERKIGMDDELKAFEEAESEIYS